MAESIKRFGFNVPIVCNDNLRIIAGHTRWKAAKDLGMKEVPVIKLHLGNQDEIAFAITENKTGELADWDAPKLKELLDELKLDLDLDSFGFSSAQIDALTAPCKDFPWDIFDKDSTGIGEKSHMLLPVRIPKARVDRVKQKIKAFAQQNGIRNKDTAIVAGSVLIKALDIECEL